MHAPIPEDYFQARHQFRLAAHEHGAEIRSYPVQVRGPNNEELTIDAAIIGSATPDNTLIVSSGLHGVEGFLGSALQAQALTRRMFKPRSATDRTVLIHALNPYGFAHLRRVNEDNVDLNRNYGSDSATDNNCEFQYEKLNAFLNPGNPPSRIRNTLFPIEAYRMIRRYGLPMLKQVIAEGQFQFPNGLFFGGTALCQATRIVQSHLADWVAGAGHVLHLDIHTGLGKHGELKLLLDNRYTTVVHKGLKTLFPAVTVDRHDSSGGAYQAKGTFAQWCEKQREDQSYIFVCAEFGTYNSLRILQALRNENHIHHWGTASASMLYRAKRHLRDCFCPNSERWRSHTVATGLSLLDCASSA